ncbi:MAG: hypothetical protein WBF17_10310 [Phycisphaerae bacterium]
MRRPLCAATLAVILAPLLLGHCSCAVFAWLAAKFSPPDKVEAQFELPSGKTVLVFVDDILRPVSHEPVKIELTNRLNEYLVANKVAARTVSYDRLADLVAGTPNFNLLAVSEVGQKLAADVVLYVQIDEFALKDEAAEQLWHGRLRATVRMVDVAKGRLWPKNRPAGYSLPAVETPTVAQSSDTGADEIARTLAAMMADQVAKLFYEHEEPHKIDWPK